MAMFLTIFLGAKAFPGDADADADADDGKAKTDNPAFDK